MMNDDENISKHAVTDPKKCREMADKYQWELLRVEPTKSQVLKFDCVFQGDTQFPNYQEEKKDE
ncbi:MAG: hypothetical protein JHC73_19190 [Dolichospermum sp.]|nr:hypothetical protein [Dolichospermum sp.]